MKRQNQLLVSSLLFFAVQVPALADDLSPYPADAEASTSVPARDTYADRQARSGGGEGSQEWGVGKRQQPTAHDPFPFGGGFQDD